MDRLEVLEKLASKKKKFKWTERHTSAAVAPVLGPLSGFFAKRGRGFSTGVGALGFGTLGEIGGSSLANRIPMTGRKSALLKYYLPSLGLMSGFSYGAWRGHGPTEINKKKKK